MSGAYRRWWLRNPVKKDKAIADNDEPYELLHHILNSIETSKLPEPPCGCKTYRRIMHVLPEPFQNSHN